MPYSYQSPQCAHEGCTKMPVVRVYGFKHNEYDDYCEAHQGWSIHEIAQRFNMPEFVAGTPLPPISEEDKAAFERELREWAMRESGLDEEIKRHGLTHD